MEFADFTEPLSEMLGRRAKAIQGQLDSFPSYRRSHQPSVQAEIGTVDVHFSNGTFDENIGTPTVLNEPGVVSVHVLFV